MLKAVTVTNFKGESLRMELTKPEETGLVIYNITGIGSPTASINTTDMATIDGSRFNSARAQTRNIVLTLVFVEKSEEYGPSNPGSSGGTSGGTTGGSQYATKDDLVRITQLINEIENNIPLPISDERLTDIMTEGGLDV